MKYLKYGRLQRIPGLAIWISPALSGNNVLTVSWKYIATLPLFFLSWCLQETVTTSGFRLEYINGGAFRCKLHSLLSQNRTTNVSAPKVMFVPSNTEEAVDSFRENTESKNPGEHAISIMVSLPLVCNSCISRRYTIVQND